MNGSGAGHSKKNMLLADLYMFDKFPEKKRNSSINPVSNKALIQRWYMVGMAGRTSQLACQRSPHVGPT
jgi:hypothetical protein